MGAYLKAKGEAERIVRESGIPWTIFRPSAFVGEDRKPVPGMGVVTRLLGLSRYQPIRVEDVASAILTCARERAPLEAILEGAPLRALVR